MDLFAYSIRSRQLISLTNPRWSQEEFRFSVQTEPAREYIVEFKNSLEEPDWELLEILIGDGALQTITEPNSSAPQKFYRIRSE